MAVFTPRIPPQEDASVSHRFRSKTVKFGDGYEGVHSDGINTKQTTWRLTFRGTDAEIDPIKTFLDAHGTHISFDWTPPGGTMVRVIMVDGYDENPSAAGNNELSVTFKRKYQP